MYASASGDLMYKGLYIYSNNHPAMTAPIVYMLHARGERHGLCSCMRAVDCSVVAYCTYMRCYWTRLFKIGPSVIFILHVFLPHCTGTVPVLYDHARRLRLKNCSASTVELYLPCRRAL